MPVGVRQNEDQCEVQGVHPEAIQTARSSLMPDSTLTTLSETFSALGDSNRMKILFALAATELCVCDLATVVGISESAVSQHLRLLRTLRWVTGKRRGKMVYYTLNDQHVHDLLSLELEHVIGA